MASSPSVRSWRMAFLTLRDETLTPPSPRTLLPTLLRTLIFSQFEILVAAAPELPRHEVISDLMLLVELAMSVTESKDIADTYVQTSRLIHDINSQMRLEFSSSSWNLLINLLEKMIQCFLYNGSKTVRSSSVVRMEAMKEVLEVFRNCSSTDSLKLVKLLLKIVSCSNALFSSSYSSGNQGIPKSSSLWEMQTVAFVMIGDIFSRAGSSVSEDMWQSALEVLRKVMDILASKCLLAEDHVMSRFYTSLLHCLHLILSEPKGPLSDHVPGLVLSLQMFFMYGLSTKSRPVFPNSGLQEATFSSQSLNSRLEGCSKSGCGGTYKPPHLRKREGMGVQLLNSSGRSFLNCETSWLGSVSSDSEHSDSDSSVKEADRFRCSKARIAAIMCIQDLCQADLKALSAQWVMLLPTNDVLQPRKYQATLMTCLLFDPVLKVRIACASALAALLDGPASVYLQVAEHKEPMKCGSFTTLSSSLGQILMQLHTGLLYLIRYESNSGLLASLFKVLVLLISATPYARMPGELLSSVVSTVHSRIVDDLAKRDHGSLLANSLNCLGAAFAVSPPFVQVEEMLRGVSTGVVVAQKTSSFLSTLFHFSQEVSHSSISIEALQALRAASHNYPNVMTACWEQVSATVSGIQRVGVRGCPSHDVLAWTLKGDGENTLSSTLERCIMAAIKVLDECLRASSGFKGTDNLLGEKLLDSPFLSDCTRTAKISSAPFYGLEDPQTLEGNSVALTSGIKYWSEAIEEHLPLALSHSAPMVRAASISCFGGMTSFVYYSLTKAKQDFTISSIINAALKDEVPSVRSAACRAIGVISCFPYIFDSAVNLDEFIHAVEINTRDLVVSVRMTASWALANISDSLRHRANSLGGKTESDSLSVLAECALRLTKDGDKVKSNAVRALGNLSRFVKFTRQSNRPVGCKGLNGAECLLESNDLKAKHNQNNDSTLTYLGDTCWLERMVNAFISCVTTGNVKVQWNVCHALGSLFLNETLKLQDMAWAPSVYSILLLLLRDSTNFKIRIHAAAALAVPTSRLDYGSSFPDIVQGLEHILESLGSDPVLEPSSFKYKDTLERQLTSTTLHMLGLSSSSDPQSLKDFLVKKASFLEGWFKSLCSSLEKETINQPAVENCVDNIEDASAPFFQKKAMISKALRSLLEVYKSSNHQNLTQRFEKLANCLS